MNEKQLIPLNDLLDRIVKVQGIKSQDQTTDFKVDILERLLESWRFYNNKPKNNLPIEEFDQYKVFIDIDKVECAVPNDFDDLGTGIPPIRLQPTLLMYLLAAHGKHQRVYDIIKGYTDQIRPYLTIVDFKKTQTGVTRCFTNTRFAANLLRDYGFLKFTRVEAYKTWVLSLPGFIVASRVFEDNDWKLSKVEKELNYDLHPTIRNAWNHFDTFDKFITQLERVCNPNRDLFKTFNSVLNSAHNELRLYWQTLNNSKLTQEQRRKESLERLKKLESLNGMKKFYDEFATSVNVNKFVSKMEKLL